MLHDSIQRIHELTKLDQIIWEYDSDNVYLATYRGKVLRLNCSREFPYFIIATAEFRLSRELADELCREIGNQWGRLRKKRREDELEELSRLLQ